MLSNLDPFRAVLSALQQEVSCTAYEVSYVFKQASKGRFRDANELCLCNVIMVVILIATIKYGPYSSNYKGLETLLTPM